MLCYVYFRFALFRFFELCFYTLYTFIYIARRATPQTLLLLSLSLSQRRRRCRCRFLLFYYSVARSHERVFASFTLPLYFTLRYFTLASATAAVAAATSAATACSATSSSRFLSLLCRRRHVCVSVCCV